MQVVRSLFGTIKFVVVWAVVFGVLGLAMTGAVTLLADNGSPEPAADSAADGDAWGAPDPVSNETAAAYEREIHDRVNAAREAEHVPRLEYRTDISDVAAAHSRDMADRDFFAHENPDGESPRGRLRAAGLTCSVVAENIASREGYSDAPSALAEEIVGQWLRSPGHRANIMDPDLEVEGVGVYATGEKVWATQVFC